MDETQRTEKVVMTWKLRIHPPNERELHQIRVDAARERMGARYLCHPANQIRMRRVGFASVDVTRHSSLNVVDGHAHD